MIIRHAIAVACVLCATAAAAASRDAVQSEMSHLAVLRTIRLVHSLPPSLQRALARTFGQRRLEMSDPSQELRQESLVRSDKESLAPMRRLVFAFETPRFYFVYYEVGHPWRGTFLVAFSKEGHESVKFAWGGANMDSVIAKSPAQIRSRFERNKFRDDLDFVW